MPTPAASAARAPVHTRTGSAHNAPRRPSASSPQNASGERIIANGPPRIIAVPPAHAYEPNTGRYIDNHPSTQSPSTVINIDDHPQDVSRYARAETMPVQKVEDLPTTVDPSQIFDQAEYMRRKAASNESSISARSGVPQTYMSSSNQINNPRSESASRERIEAEMKAMFDKMREYRATDPATFSEALESIKKAQQPPRASSQTPQMANASPVQSGTAQQDAAALISPHLIVDDLASISADTSSVDPKAATKPENEELPDLGKFPAMRRRRRSAKIGTAANEQPQRIEIPQNPEHSDMLSVDRGDTSSGAQSTLGQLQSKSEVAAPDSSSVATTGGIVPGKTFWPEAKRNHLAETAVQWLKGDPINAGKQLTKGDILGLLERNPTYDQLCDIMFQQGFKFHKGAFARALLVSMSGDNSLSANEATKKRKRDSPPGEARKQHRTDPTSQRIVEEAVETTTYPRGSEKLVKQASASGPANSNATSAHSQEAEDHKAALGQAKLLAGAAAQKAADNLVNTSKEAMARKQNFNDLVDLTALEESDDDNALPIPMPAFVQASTAMNWQGEQRPRFNEAQSVESHQPPARTSNSAPSQGAGIDRHRKPLLAMPLDRNKALRRSTYNPATIARDFLIAKGEHPTERALNAHLEILMAQFKEVNVRTDLSTFRWDLVDPGDPVDEHGKPVRFTEIDREKEQVHDDTRDKKLVNYSISKRQEIVADHSASPKQMEVVQSSAVARSNRVNEPSQPLPTTETPTPTPTPSRGHRGRPRGRPPGRAQLQSVTPRVQVQASTATNAQSAPSGPARHGIGITIAASRGRGARVVGSPSINRHQQSSSNKSPTISTDVKMPTFVAIDSDVFKKPANFVEGEGYVEVRVESDSDSSSQNAIVPSSTSRIQPATEVSALSTTALTPASKRRGRPPKTPQSSGATATVASPGDALPKRRGRPPGSTNTPGSRGSAFPSKRGRPPKARPSQVNRQIPSDGIGVMIRSRSPSSAPVSVSYIEDKPEVELKPKRWKARPTYPSSTPDSDAFVSFRCAWIGCRAELHNLETLRKHLFKVHEDKCFNDATKRFSCFWNPCGQIDAFASVAEWQQHIDETHVEAMARQLGDGPTVHPVGKRVVPAARAGAAV